MVCSRLFTAYGVEYSLVSGFSSGTVVNSTNISGTGFLQALVYCLLQLRITIKRLPPMQVEGYMVSSVHLPRRHLLLRY